MGLRSVNRSEVIDHKGVMQTLDLGWFSFPGFILP